MSSPRRIRFALTASPLSTISSARALAMNVVSSS
jgi:hypothetical protein